jgi:hypothetical protein
MLCMLIACGEVPSPATDARGTGDAEPRDAAARHVSRELVPASSAASHRTRTRLSRDGWSSSGLDGRVRAARAPRSTSRSTPGRSRRTRPPRNDATISNGLRLIHLGCAGGGGHHLYVATRPAIDDSCARCQRYPGLEPATARGYLRDDGGERGSRRSARVWSADAILSGRAGRRASHRGADADARVARRGLATGVRVPTAHVYFGSARPGGAGSFEVWTRSARLRVTSSARPRWSREQYRRCRHPDLAIAGWLSTLSRATARWSPAESADAVL